MNRKLERYIYTRGMYTFIYLYVFKKLHKIRIPINKKGAQTELLI